MSEKQTSSLPTYLWELFQRLRRRGFVVAPQDYEALRLALQAGFGLSSQVALRDLCAALWAKSLHEQETLFALFDQLAPIEEYWFLAGVNDESKNIAEPKQAGDSGKNSDNKSIDPKSNQPDQSEQEQPTVASSQGLPTIFLGDVKIAERPFVFEPQYPLTFRQVAQAWRRLRRPVRTGPSVELDIDSTIEKFCRLGVGSSVVLRPQRRNVARLLILMDRQGSMAPFHGFCDEVCEAIQRAGRFEDTELYYFHNIPAEGADETVLDLLEEPLFPSFDPILPQIQPLTEGDLYTDPDLLDWRPLETVLEKYAHGASVVIIGDAGAARRQYRGSRFLDMLSFFKGVRVYTPHYVWLNPLPQNYWEKSTAAYLSRHIPMFSLDREGMYQAVNVLRGQQFTIEKPI
ncbi:MAG: hypothetical protein QNJ46_34750 [Leptolyngbyaceae cyanobacterium MO_188.B28]|nr:hypothetical protein [Leptolyngbyaceae cyanobacterium MO_188.B28]